MAVSLWIVVRFKGWRLCTPCQHQHCSPDWAGRASSSHNQISLGSYFWSDQIRSEKANRGTMTVSGLGCSQKSASEISLIDMNTYFTTTKTNETSQVITLQFNLPGPQITWKWTTYLGRQSNTTLRILSVKGGGSTPQILFFPMPTEAGVQNLPSEDQGGTRGKMLWGGAERGLMQNCSVLAANLHQINIQSESDP